MGKLRTKGWGKGGPAQKGDSVIQALVGSRRQWAGLGLQGPGQAGTVASGGTRRGPVLPWLAVASSMWLVKENTEHPIWDQVDF